MAIQLVFCKSDETPWGFRLTGGADCEIPLTVIKVAESSIAEAVGLQVEDIILKINEYNGEDLSHIEAHDVLMEAGNNFTMTIVRSQIQDDESNEEVKQILEQSLQLQTDHPQDNFGNQQQHKGLKVHFNDECHQNEVALNHRNSCSPPVLQETSPQNLLQQKKWSTFLQKPCRPIPKKNEAEKQFAEPYKVVIKKQPKRGSKDVEDAVNALQKGDEDVIEAPAQEYEENEENEEPPVIEETVSEPIDEFEHVSAEYISEEEVETEQEEPFEDKEEDVVEEPPSLELQLAQIQQQLQSLAQVPTSIQDTLEALTEQLAKIVGVSQTPQTSEQEVILYEEQGDDDDEHSYDDEHLESIIEENVEVLDSSDEYKLDITDMSDMSEDEANYYDVKVNYGTHEDEKRLEQEQEAERIRQQQELEKSIKQDRTEEFHQRRLEQRPTVPLAPVQRPIILPGGRKWSEPDDALPKPRKSKMTDEKICETLDNYSEIVTGHTKGINFLKYQPAPKNLDYLQRSEVFKMIHEADPPKSGIAARSGLVVSEEDYYRSNPEVRT